MLAPPTRDVNLDGPKAQDGSMNRRFNDLNESVILNMRRDIAISTLVSPAA